MNADLLDKHNWQKELIAAVDEFPEDLRMLIGYFVTSPESATITVAVEPTDRDHDGEIRRVEVRYWNSLREQKFPPEQEALYAPGGLCAEQADWPVVSIERETGGVRHGPFPGRASLALFRFLIQDAILEELYKGSIIYKRVDGTFLRENGSVIFPLWSKRK
jgi:hypothetical protein